MIGYDGLFVLIVGKNFDQMISWLSFVGNDDADMIK